MAALEEPMSKVSVADAAPAGGGGGGGGGGGKKPLPQFKGEAMACKEKWGTQVSR